MVRSRRKQVEMIEVREKILTFCSGTPKSLSEISDFLQMNRHTLRTSYIYRMVRENLLNTVGLGKNTRYKV